MPLGEIGAFLLVLVAALIFGNLWFQFVEAILSQIKKLFTRRKEQQECSDFSKRHFPPHFVANFFIKKSVKAASSSSCDT